MKNVNIEVDSIKPVQEGEGVDHFTISLVMNIRISVGQRVIKKKIHTSQLKMPGEIFEEFWNEFNNKFQEQRMYRNQRLKK